jgi:diguanylate cyclase (GGDEF)-like protein
MNLRRLLPGVVLGLLGVGSAIAGLLTGQMLWFLPAAVCSLAAGMLSLVLAERLEVADAEITEVAGRAEHFEAESDQMAARAARFEAEALAAKTTLAETMRADALRRQTVGAATEYDGVTDAETGLFNEPFFMCTLDKRVSTARRGLRPLASVLVDVVTDIESHDRPPAKLVAGVLIDTLRDADTACRLDDGTFAMVLEDTPENGAVWTVERLRRCLGERVPGATLWAGVACYPAHAFDAEQILTRATGALKLAHEWRQDRIEVATPADD